MALQVTRLRVEQFRRFRQPLELDGFEAGLNILSAPNEAGKSTLVRAIRAAFFERHRSTSVDDLRPWGEGSSCAPHIELDFSLDGQQHHLIKSFLGKKRCTLQIGARTLDGTDAEDHLAQVFGFSFAGRGATKPEHWGIPGLLWVEQGTGQELDVQHARDHLHDALKDQLGGATRALAATGGDEILGQLRSHRGELLTSTGRPRAAYAEAAELIGTLEAEINAADAQIGTYRQQVDQLAALRGQHHSDEESKPWDVLGADLLVARKRQEVIRSTQDRLQSDNARLAQLEGMRELLVKELEGLSQQQSNAEARAQALIKAAQDLHDSDLNAQNALENAEKASRRANAARDVWRIASQGASRATLQQQLSQAQVDADACAVNLQRAEDSQQRLIALRASAAAAPTISKTQVQHVLRLDRSARDADLRHQAVATRLQFSLPEGQRVELLTRGASQSLHGQGEQLLDAPTTMQLPGGGALVITPGGVDLADLARVQSETREELNAALQVLGVSDVAEAQARLAFVNDSDAQIKLGEQALTILAPQGLEPLRKALADAQSRIKTAQEALGRLPEVPDRSLPPFEQVEAEIEAAAGAEQVALAALARAQQLQAGGKSLHDAAQREHATAQAALTDPARAQRHAQAQQKLLTNGEEHEALSTRISQASVELRAAQPELVAQDIERLQRSIEQMTRSHQQRREQILVLESALEQAGAHGLEEQRDALAGKLAHAQRRHDDLLRRANALDLLCSMLEEKRQATLARLQAPLQERLQHYLPLLAPGATVQMDADLAMSTLARTQANGVIESGPVQDLSFGAREQFGLISRFAYADLLQQAGRPTLLILDDALVHSDSSRLAQMKRVLFDAAQRHQVLLFTCHPQDWRDMGVAVRSLN
ncbi:MAG: AAA family ATPase [Proteobacteria bacterium]|nr:AAA family ATPase [Pseudomonadota bacterium]